MSVISVNTDADFDSKFLAAAGKLILMDFSAKWCGPCRAIEPFVRELAGRYPDVVFLKVDVDDCPESAARYQVSAMPTFIFVKNRQTLAKIRGANKVDLEAKLAEFSGQGDNDASPQEDVGVPGMSDLTQYIKMAQTNCLNEDDDHPLKYALQQENEDLYLQSDCDAELLIHVEFNQPVKLHSLKLIGRDPEHSPASIKLFINQPHNMDFDSARDNDPVQELQLTKDCADGLVPLRFVKYQNVSNVTLFVAGNHGDHDETKIHRLMFIGKTVAVTNMNEFKRVAGKAGESH